ncbi:Gfo/Idh/MocA family oxidoreductase, partial [Synoicihabitans lomoniglobus]|uniref:Gfo/Idh/MocA family protein n=1 Tax=Synoicihabitans lomoniglobus TaxID=2909285 RepID=UPI002ED06849|nr:Gfo/Idh/MocA family oxidoreductase [Opitutaceae bacterium LMO-M01]
SAQAFAAEHGIAPERAHGSWEALFADPEVDAVYVATPHPHHAGAVVAALAAGKHVLCEKPFAMSLAEVDAMQAAAREHQRTLMEAWMYRCHPQTAKLVAMVREGAIGELRHVQAAFSFNAPFDPAGRLWNKALGGGAVLDVGGYPLSYARLLAGVAQGKPFLDPEALHAVGHVHLEAGTDLRACAVVRFAGNITAELSCGTDVSQQNVVRVYGSAGMIVVPSPYVISRDASPTTLEWHREGRETEVITITPDRDVYAYEADALAEAVSAGKLEVAACPWADTRGNMAGLIDWHEQIGVNYLFS